MITLVNLRPPRQPLGENMEYVRGDGRDLPFGDGEFDIGYSNSTIEHLGTYEDQLAFAGEIRRVGRSIWVQTPARSFVVEPHLVTPLVHFLPTRLQRKLLRYLTVWGWITRPTQGMVEDFLAEVRLLSFQEMRALFPDCIVKKEKFLGLTKAFIAVRRNRSDEYR
jgi:hypothetical protein